ncbi:type II toxin-antitoxin system VapC family toxin [Aquibium sp. ELW1220]|uniref:type II toxin-antitoxin system VapC family toxin n=1 Tax=Aquibium sp. ELW1220 TaxID=2976766 RepID=UPI0025B0EDFC|nr:type II toxin-antitoxin system VapC family toxin [Aquibium sp. ELW1220]MDN2580121.1 type II toxin-antitoxin system VapC family toxin [Aquibium sp. ELW1220]
MTIVVDSSIALAWFLPDENSPLALDVLMQVTESGALVPQHFQVEFGNALVMAVRRKRIDRDYRRRTFERISGLELTIDRAGGDRMWTDTVELADEHGLTLYDGLYLELALRTGLPLATLDKRLAKAALDIGRLRK